jgi:hypothetical protein
MMYGKEIEETMRKGNTPDLSGPWSSGLPLFLDLFQGAGICHRQASRLN